jgi:lipid II:glycine glycyltransferase (peptidoglycan interpeptide bridge formation enzyme)
VTAVTTDGAAAASEPGMAPATAPGAAIDEPLATAGKDIVDVASLDSDDAAWDRFVASAPGGSYPQLSAWAEANAANHWSARRIVVDGPSGPIGAQLLLHRMQPGPFQRGYAARGPVAVTLDRPALAAFTGALQRAAAGLRLSHVVIDPEVEPGPVQGWLSDLGWRPIPAIQVDRTRVVDLTLPEAALWSDLRSSARWSVNKARRTGHTVEDAGAAGLDEFGELYLETARRVGFHAGAAYRETFEAFDRRRAARLLIARDADGRAVATLMLLDCGDRVIERYGASSAKGAAARANYLVKWESIRASRERGMTSYDMWGTDREGVATFKASFGGAERQYIGAWELVTNRFVHAGFVAIARLRDRPPRSIVAGDQGEPTTAYGLSVVDIATEAPDGWDQRVVAAPGGHVMQGTAWAAHRRAQGADPRFVTFSDGQGVLVVLRHQPLTVGSIATVRRGPAHGGGSGVELAGRIGVLGAALARIGARELFVDPELDADPAYEASMDALGAVVTAEYQPSIHVMRLPLPTGSTEASIWAGVTKTTRQRVRAAERLGTIVRHDDSGQLLEAFGELLVERADALGIAMRPELGYLAAWRRLLAAGQARLLLAEHDGQLAGGLLIFVQGGIHATAYSADRAALRRELPGTMHLVRWTAIREAIAAGATAIELGGVDLPGHREPPGPEDPSHGLYMHKSSFGAQWVIRTPARRLILRPRAVRLARARDQAVDLGRRIVRPISGAR